MSESRWRLIVGAGLAFMASTVARDTVGQQANSTPYQAHISTPSNAASFPAAVWFDSRSPVWSLGNFARLTIGDFPAGVEVYDRKGKLISQTYVSIPRTTDLWLIGATPTGNGGAIVSGQLTNEEKTTDFLAETSASGGVVEILQTETFLASRICKAADGTIWTLGRDSIKESDQQLDYELVRRYSFEKGLLRGYLSRSAVNFHSEGVTGAGEGEDGTFLVCGKDRVSIFFNETKEYVEIDPSKESLKRWNVPMTPLDGGRVTGLAVTDQGRVYASLFELKEEGDTKTHGLFELQTNTTASIGRWVPVSGTLNTQPRLDDAPKGSFFKLWGADGEALVIRGLFDADMQWVRVVP